MGIRVTSFVTGTCSSLDLPVLCQPKRLILGGLLGQFFWASASGTWSRCYCFETRRLSLHFESLWFSASPTSVPLWAVPALFVPKAGPDIEKRQADCTRWSHLQHIYILLCLPMISKNINPMKILLWYHNQKRCTYSCMGKLTHKSLTGIAILGSFFSKAIEEAHWSDVYKKDAIWYAIR